MKGAKLTATSRTGYRTGPQMWGTHLRMLGRREKSYICVPPEFARAIGREVVLTWGLGSVVLGMAPRTFEGFIGTQPDGEARRFYGGGAHRTVFTDAGRRYSKIYLPLPLRRWSDLLAAEEVVVAGIGWAFVICRPERWDRALRAWEAQQMRLAQDAAELALRLPESIGRKAA